jgi:hypothetical protein
VRTTVPDCPSHLDNDLAARRSLGNWSSQAKYGMHTRAMIGHWSLTFHFVQLLMDPSSLKRLVTEDKARHIAQFM